MPPFCKRHKRNYEMVTLDNGAQMMCCVRCRGEEEVEKTERIRRAAVGIPEDMTVYQLIDAIKDLREDLHHAIIRAQNAEAKVSNKSGMVCGKCGASSTCFNCRDQVR